MQEYEVNCTHKFVNQTNQSIIMW